MNGGKPTVASLSTRVAAGEQVLGREPEGLLLPRVNAPAIRHGLHGSEGLRGTSNSTTNNDIKANNNEKEAVLNELKHLVWLLERSADDSSCEFIRGFDGRHFHSAGFRWAFDKEVGKFPVGPLSDHNAQSLKKRLATKWAIEWIAPDDVPSPYSQGPPM